MVVRLDSLTCFVDGSCSLRTLWVFCSILILWAAYWVPLMSFSSQLHFPLSNVRSCDHISAHVSNDHQPPTVLSLFNVVQFVLLSVKMR